MRDVPSSMVRSQAGAPCMSDIMCAPLACDQSVAGGVCTGPCMDGPQPSEAAQCGGAGATCLSRGDGPEAESICARACRPSMNSGCRQGFVCTGFWFTHQDGEPDSPGCFPFCQSDAQCGDGQRCNPRSGQCGMRGFDPTKLADGLACEPVAPGADDPCRGFCVAIDGNQPSKGICASFINLATTQECPDEPLLMQPVGRGGSDNLGLCLFRSCNATQCCPAALTCEDIGMGGDGGCLPVHDPNMPAIECTVARDGGLGSETGVDAR